MQWTAEIIKPKSLRLVIERQTLTSLIPGVPDQDGYYLYVWENEQGIHDDLQDDLEAAMDVALRMFMVPKDAWRQEA